MFYRVMTFVIAGCSLWGSVQADQSDAPFTGRVNSTRVRLRTAAKLDAPIVRELEKQELVVVLGVDDEFYAVQAPPDISGFVFRTYVLDGAIEGTRVNVRLSPSLEAPVLTQLNSGDKVDGTLCEDNPKWLKISLPATTRLYISKDYVDNVGPIGLINELSAGRDLAERKLMEALFAARAEMRKPFDTINHETLTAGFKFANFGDLKSVADQAKAVVEDAFLEKKVAFLESKTRLLSGDKWETYEIDVAESQKSFDKSMDELATRLPEALQSELRTRLAALPAVAASPVPDTAFMPATDAHVATSATASADDSATGLVISHEVVPSNEPKTDHNPKFAGSVGATPWVSVEHAIFERWSAQNPSRSVADMYDEEQLNGTKLYGELQPFNDALKNKPGDFVLVNPNSRLPVAYLYSTQVDLASQVGKTLTLIGASRPNNNFAFPAYHVLKVQ